MDGMQMMLNALGLKPEAIEAKVSEVIGGIQALLQQLDNRLQNIEAKIDALTEASKNGGSNPG